MFAFCNFCDCVGAIQNLGVIRTMIQFAPEGSVPINADNPIHLTDRRLFKQCRRKYKYDKLDRLELSSIHEGNANLWFGTGIHYALEYFYTNRNPWKGWEDFCSNYAEVDENLDKLARNIIDRYFKKYAQTDLKWKILGVEQELSFDIVLPSGVIVRLVMRMDLMIENEMGEVYIVDHKTFTQEPDTRALLVDDQMTGYFWGAVQKGYNITGVIYNAIRKKIPTVPKLLKTGEYLSKDKSIDTLHDTYLEEILKHNFDPDDYLDILQHLEQKGDTFLIREKLYRNEFHLQDFEDNLVAELEEIVSPKTVMYPNFTRDCGWCEFSTLCKAQSRGEDTDRIIRLMYQTKDHGKR